MAEKEKQKEVKEEPASKEVEAIFKALHAYEKKHNGDIIAVLSVVAFDKENEIVDDRIGLYGPKGGLYATLDALKDEIDRMEDN